MNDSAIFTPGIYFFAPFITVLTSVLVLCRLYHAQVGYLSSPPYYLAVQLVNRDSNGPRPQN